MKLPSGLGHLTYSTLVHPGDSWAQMWESLTTYLPRIKERLSPDAPFGVCLRLSADAARELSADDEARLELRRFLAEQDMYVFTANAFVYGQFKETRVKEQVYEPDWRTDQRAVYTMQVADVLAEICPPDIEPSIQSPPLGFKPRVTDAAVVRAYADQVLRVVAHLDRLRHRTGRTVTLALEPEPACFLETTDETIAFFRDHLFTGDAARRLAVSLGYPVSEAHAILRRHLGVVFDACHHALQYESMADALAALVDAGIPIRKLQAAAALHVPEVTPEIADTLDRYTDTIYLTQTLERREGRIVQYLGLEEALEAWRLRPDPCEWRIHFHVPVFLDRIGRFRSTRDAIAEMLEAHRQQPLSMHVEVETYTWDVLPDDLRSSDIVDDICRELEWTRAAAIGADPDEVLAAR